MKIDICIHPDYDIAFIDHFNKWAGSPETHDEKIKSDNYEIILDYGEQFTRLLSYED